MNRTLCKSKVHGAVVTEANLHYTGSLTLDELLMQAADLIPYEQVHVVNLHNGVRFETYCIPGRPGSGMVCLNGAAARLGVVDDRLIILSYAQLNEDELEAFAPKFIFVDEQNHIQHVSNESATPPSHRNP